MSSAVFDRVFRDPTHQTWVFVGVGGVSMCSLCRLSHGDGFSVIGCDKVRSAATDLLMAEGIPVYIGHRAENLPKETTLVVYSLAVPADAPELQAAAARGIPCVSRPVFFGAYMHRFTERIGVAGTHGKSTVTAMLHRIFAEACYMPTTLCGTEVHDPYAYVRGKNAYLLYESCEYKRALLSFSPTVLLLLNAEWDHPDCYADKQALVQTFLQAAQQAPAVIVSADDSSLEQMARILPHIKTFGLAKDADLRYEVQSTANGCCTMSVWEKGVWLGCLALRVPGTFQCANAAAALCCARQMGVPFDVACRALETFDGIGRRMEPMTLPDGKQVIYDYAHHPTEIRAVISAYRGMYHRAVCVVFRPHTYSRTAALWQDFVNALSEADEVIITDIYAAREAPLPGISAQCLAESVGASARYVPLSALPAAVHACQRGIILMGAGDLSVLTEGACSEDGSDHVM